MGKNRKLTPAEVKEFLAKPMVARIATIDENGVPYVTPVWQEWDGEAFWIVPRERAGWIGHIKKNPNVGISCAEDSGTYKRITAQGKAEIVFGPAPMQGQCLDVANRMAVRFLGEHGPEYLVPTYDPAALPDQDRPHEDAHLGWRRVGQEIYREIVVDWPNRRWLLGNRGMKFATGALRLKGRGAETARNRQSDLSTLGSAVNIL